MKQQIRFVLSLFVVGILINPCDAQLRSPEKIRVVYSAIGASQSTLWIPYEAGIFRKNGVEVELLYVGGGSRASQVLVSGDVAVGVFSGATVVSANLAGGDLAIIAAGTDVLPFILVAHPDVKRVEDLRGKKIGITRFGSTTDFALRFVANKWGLRTDTDFAVLQLGGQPEMMAGLVGGAVQAAMLNAEFAILAKREKYTQLVDVASLGLPFPTGTLNTSRTYIRKNEDVVRRLVRGYVEGIHFAKNRREFSVGVLTKYLKNQDSAFVNAVYDMYIQQFIPKVPNPSLDAVRTVLSQLGEKDPKAGGFAAAVCGATLHARLRKRRLCPTTVEIEILQDPNYFTDGSMIVDIHAHFTPPEWIIELQRNGSMYGCRIDQDESGKLWLRLAEGKPKELTPALGNLSLRLEAMTEMGVDRQVLSPVMNTVGYELDARYGQALSRLFNETNVEIAKEYDGIFIPVATIPMQSSRAAVEELDYAVKTLRIRMIEIGTHVNGLNLDEEVFRPFFERAADLGVLVQIHPHKIAAPDRLRRYNLSNLVGNPVDTAIAAASLIFGGILDRYPSLNVCLVHGGGALPYLLGRFSHGYVAFAESYTTPEPPETYFRRFYFDSLAHDARLLKFLHSLVGTERLMLGTDCPYDAGDKHPLETLRKAGLENEQKILGGNAVRLLGLN